jgi:16S rRNA (guanine527-N7)-methyltransferase
VPADEIERYAGCMGRSVDGVTRDLESYCALLVQWNAAQNLVSRETLELWQRHVVDSVQLVRFLGPQDSVVADIGSGGGLPAIPLAIALKGRTGLTYRLIEANTKKVAFLKAARRALGLDFVEVVRGRAEQAEPIAADVVTARAVASLVDLLLYVSGVIAPSGRALLHKGREHVDEIALARTKWRFDVIVHASDVDPDGVILEISGLSPLV